MMRVYVLHENPVWFAPLRAALLAAGVPHEEWLLDTGSVDISQPPPEGVFFNRLSASAHARGHNLATEYARTVLRWLEAHGRRVVNSSEALELAMSKSALISALNASGIRVPYTVVAIGQSDLLGAAKRFRGPFLLKPNRGGKGLGIQRFSSAAELQSALRNGVVTSSPDGVTLVQEYIQPAEPSITRAEFVGGELLYALRSDVRQGFNLCPADDCKIPDSRPSGRRFFIERGNPHGIINTYRAFLKRHGIEIAAIEFLVDRHGVAYTYDLNINTNYNAEAEAEAGLSGQHAIATFLGRELDALNVAIPLKRVGAER